MKEFDKIILALIVGFVLGTFIMMCVFTSFGTLPEARKARYTCEVELPRNLVCEMVFVPQRVPHD